MTTHDERPAAGGYTTIIFDVNGTLLGYDDPLGFEKRFAAACREWGAEVGPEDVQAAMRAAVGKWAAWRQEGNRRASSAAQYRRTMTWFYQTLIEALALPADLPGDSATQAAALYERFIVREGFMPPFAETHDVLARLQARGIRMGILSNYPPHLEDALKRHGIHGYFDFFVVSSLVGMEKPDPAIFALAVAKAGRPLEEILYVGDDPHDDLEGARAAGLTMILVDRTGRWRDVDCPRIRRLTDLLDLLSAPA
jgi:putative hydrolase of the HAD superfamily